jgi:NADH-quinone oxidoreductase subunit C
MSVKLQRLCEKLTEIFGVRVQSLTLVGGEVTLEVAPADYFAVAQTLRDHPELHFEQLMDISGVDYLSYGRTDLVASDDGRSPRFAAVSHLLSLKHNWRLRLRVYAADDSFPVVASVTPIWNGANWFEREAFDLYGILFEGHDDLRRILTDYGFVGHPFRKDFPVTGYVEMRYDPEQKRVVYQPVTIEPREVTPRIIREENYGRG